MADLSTQERQIQFIADNIQHLARAAYAGFRDAGQGVLVVLPEEHDDRPGNLSILQYHYMKSDELLDVITARGIDSSKLRQLEDQISHHVEDYDASRSIVITFLRQYEQDQEINVYRVESPTPPAAAYAAFVN